MRSSRKLPDWMLAKSASMTDTKKHDHSSMNLEVSELPDISHLKYPGKIIYCHHKDECNFICEEINKRRSSSGYFVYGFDIEWKVSYKTGDYKRTAVLQLCENDTKAYVFHLSQMNGFPSELKQLLETEQISKVGVGIQGDIERLMVDYQIKVMGAIDLSTLANEKLCIFEKWSLNGLLMNQLHLQLCKDRSVRCSDWEDYPLTHTQLQYAALDAYAGLLIFKKLTEVL